jgi:DNA (cytosine-5)-methyltransferase 1
MKKVKSRDTSIEIKMEKILAKLGIKYGKQPKIYGKPDFIIKDSKILIFCDSSFWHGRRKEEISGRAFKSNRSFWVKKLTENKKRDSRINRKLRKEGWKVLRFWDDDIQKNQNIIKGKLSRVLAKDESPKLTALDLFCGAGGLSLGLKNAGFNVVAGVEIDKEIGKTYAANHPGTKLIYEDIRKVKGEDILKLVGLKKIDLIAGCPPCQGFSSLTSKYKREDERNILILEMVRLIEELKPKMVMLENVSGITTRGKTLLDEFVLRIEAMGYIVNKAVLQMADYGIPQSRKRFVLLAGKGFKIEFPRKSHSPKGDEKEKLKPWVTLENVIMGIRKPVTLAESFKRGGPQKFNWHVVSELKDISRKRMMALSAGSNRYALPTKLRPKCHAHKKEGFSNVYGRLSWKQTCPTITSGVTTPAMGRFGHPDEIRTLSIREAAMIQTFPKSYRFITKYMKTACELVGNGLPPRFAELAAKACLDGLFMKQVVQ